MDINYNTDNFKIETLSKVSYFKKLNLSYLRQFLPLMAYVQYKKNDILIKENDFVDNVIIIIDGVVEIYTNNMKQLVATGTKNDVLGLTDTALFSKTQLRTATVKADTAVNAYVISIDALKKILVNMQGHHATILPELDMISRILLIKMSTPFSSLPSNKIINLAKKTELLHIEPETLLIKKGELGGDCFLIEEGEVAIIDYDQHGNEVIINKLGKGALIGEMSVVNVSPRSKSIKAISKTSLLVIHRDQFLEMLHASMSTSVGVMKLFLERSYPLKLDSIEEIKSESEDNEIFYILKNPKNHKYFRLSEVGWTIWRQLDGHHNILNIAEQVFHEHHLFLNEEITNLIGHLYADGYIDLNISEEFQKIYEANINKALSKKEKFILALRSILEYRYVFENVDEKIGKLYHYISPVLFNKNSRLIFLSIIMTGLISFISITDTAISYSTQVEKFIWIFFPLVAVNILLHEASHALTLKSFNRSIHAVGVGWHWISPIFFVDTTDIWFCSTIQKIKVYMAGIYSDMLFISICSIAGLALKNYMPLLTSFLWLYSLIGMVFIIFNLNPAIEFDGYYVLSAILKKPNLRKYSILFLSKLLNLNPKKRRFFRDHSAETAYCLISILYVIIAPIFLYYISPIIFYNFFSIYSYHESWVFYQWIIPVIFLLLSSFGVIVDIHHYNEFRKK